LDVGCWSLHTKIQNFELGTSLEEALGIHFLHIVFQPGKIKSKGINFASFLGNSDQNELLKILKSPEATFIFTVNIVQDKEK
jgi:hypothetical protein